MFVAVRFGRYVVLLAVGLERSGRFWTRQGAILGRGGRFWSLRNFASGRSGAFRTVLDCFGWYFGSRWSVLVATWSC